MSDAPLSSMEDFTKRWEERFDHYYTDTGDDTEYVKRTRVNIQAIHKSHKAPISDDQHRSYVDLLTQIHIRTQLVPFETGRGEENGLVALTLCMLMFEHQEIHKVPFNEKTFDIWWTQWKQSMAAKEIWGELKECGKARHVVGSLKKGQALVAGKSVGASAPSEDKTLTS